MNCATTERLPTLRRRMGWIAVAIALASTSCAAAEEPLSEIRGESLSAADAVAVEALVDSGAMELDPAECLRVRVTNLSDSPLRFEVAAIVDSELGSELHYGLAVGELGCEAGDEVEVDFPLDALALPTAASDAPGVIQLIAIVEPLDEPASVVTAPPLYFEALDTGFVVFDE